MYTETSIACAVSEIKMGNSLKKTAAKYHMSRFMLRRRVKEEAGLFTREKQGRTPALPTIEEKLAECIIQMALLGFGPTRTESIDIIHEYIVANRIRTRFKNDRPSYDWLNSFMMRHQLKLKKGGKCRLPGKMLSLTPLLCTDFMIL